MSKKHKTQTIAERPLHERIARARQEGRTQQALDLTRQYYKLEQTEERRELLRQVTLERGRQLQTQGSTGDAVTVFNNALALGGSPEFIAAVAQCLAQCGAATQALGVINSLQEPEQRLGVLHHVVDGAVAKGPAGRTGLPAEQQAPFDWIMQAFAHYEANRDDDARAALQNIGLQSPFLEWKLLLRGLLAHYGEDDARAIENWQRLDPTRLPYRVCAPLRAKIDPGFFNAQPVAIQQKLRAKMMQQQGVAFAPMLRELRELLNLESLARAFRKGEEIVRLLKRDFPDLLPRLGHCFFWAIVDNGEPEDIERFIRVFGFPHDDPQGFRLEALALESRGMWPEAHKAWQNFIRQIDEIPQAWPGDSTRRVQALIWQRMAENAGPFRKRRRHSGNPLFDLFAAHTGPLKPSAEECLEQSIKLGPDRLEAYRDLFLLYRQAKKLPKAKKLGAELLKRFPDHAETLEALGELCLDTRDFKKALEYFEKAIQINPLDQTLRGDLARARRIFGVSLTIAKKFDDAREQYQQALKLSEGTKTPILCQWAVAEIKAANPTRAEELIALALAETDQRLACRYALVGESVRAKLSAKEKKQIAQKLKEALAQAPTPGEILVLLEAAAQQRLTHDDTFHGQKTQEKTILKFLEGLRLHEFNEAQLERMCRGLQVLGARKPWFNCLQHARRQFLKSVFFRLSFVDYYLMDSDARNPKTHLAREHLDDARRLIEQMPRGELQQQFMEEIKEKEKIITELNSRRPGMMDMFDNFFNSGGFGPMFGDEDEDEDAFYDEFDDDDF
ncbi:MAG: tetratricopeptide repeat protein [Planctomycetes bacterium]|nr:tetratricopeptide repeat protein [Planctomycetota bacterium]